MGKYGNSSLIYSTEYPKALYSMKRIFVVRGGIVRPDLRALFSTIRMQLFAVFIKAIPHSTALFSLLHSIVTLLSYAKTGKLRALTHVDAVGRLVLSSLKVNSTKNANMQIR